MKRLIVLRTTVMVASVVVVLSCRRPPVHAGLDVELINNTTNVIDWSVIEFGKEKVVTGAMGGDGIGGGGATVMDYRRPITDVATVSVDYHGRRNLRYVVSIKTVYNPRIPGTLSFEIAESGVIPHFKPFDSEK